MQHARIGLLLIALMALSGCLRQEPNRAPVIHYGLHGGADSAGVHTVSGGDTLWDISQRYRLSMQDIIYLNKLYPPYALDTGDRLVLPPPATYQAQAHDTLYGISRTFDVSMTELARLNRLSAPYTIRPGENVRLPSVQPETVTVAARKKPQSSRYASNATQSRARTTKATSSRQSAMRTPARAGSRFIWPADGPILSSYGPKAGGLHNDGINIKAPKGAPVRAAENGVVVYSGNQLKGFGNLVLVRHADRWLTAYAHLDRITVKKGQELKRGENLGTVGQTGMVDTPQLHFETRRGTDALNPQMYLARQGS